MTTKEIAMDALLQLLVPEIPSLPGLKRHQSVFNWESQNHPQEPITYRWGPHVELIISQLQPFLLELLPKNYTNESWVVLDVAPKSLDLMEREANGEDVNWAGHSPDALLTSLMDQHDRWVLIFEPQYDRIDRTYRVGTKQALEKLKSNLRRDTEKEGFILFPPEH